MNVCLRGWLHTVGWTQHGAHLEIGEWKTTKGERIIIEWESVVNAHRASNARHKHGWWLPDIARIPWHTVGGQVDGFLPASDLVGNGSNISVRGQIGQLKQESTRFNRATDAIAMVDELWMGHWMAPPRREQAPRSGGQQTKIQYFIEAKDAANIRIYQNLPIGPGRRLFHQRPTLLFYLSNMPNSQ